MKEPDANEILDIIKASMTRIAVSNPGRSFKQLIESMAREAAFRVMGAMEHSSLMEGTIQREAPEWPTFPEGTNENQRRRIDAIVNPITRIASFAMATGTHSMKEIGIILHGMGLGFFIEAGVPKAEVIAVIDNTYPEPEPLLKKGETDAERAL